MKRPSILRAIAEPVRATGEFATSLGLRPFSRLLPPGDGHPVIVLPGFMAGDGSTAALRQLLRSIGYDTHGWGLGRNIGPTEKILNGLPELLMRVTASGRQASVIGWSLGGIYARHMAARSPHAVRLLVTLGTPVRSEVHDTSNASPLFQALKAIHVPGHPMLDGGQPLSVPVTAVHTRSDGIVHWETCLIENAPNAENLRVRGSHTGLGFNPAVAFVIADRLAQPPGEWQPFEPPPPYRRIITQEPGRTAA